MLLKLAESVSFSLVASDEKRHKKHLIHENGKLKILEAFNNSMYGALNTDMLVHKNLAKLFKIGKFPRLETILAHGINIQKKGKRRQWFTLIIY